MPLRVLPGGLADVHRAVTNLPFFGNLTIAYKKLSTIVPVRVLKNTLCSFVAECGFFSISQVLLRAS